jgi:hypothetical protein
MSVIFAADVRIRLGGFVRRLLASWLSMVLSFSLALPAGAQEAGGLGVVVVAGQDAVHDLAKGQVTLPVVEVRDPQGNPVEGVEVRFASPLSGPSGTFYGAMHAATVKTDAAGRATADGFMPNGETGNYAIEVTAEHQGRQAAASIPQTNFANPVLPPRKRFFGWRMITAIAAGVAIVVTAVILRGNES